MLCPLSDLKILIHSTKTICKRNVENEEDSECDECKNNIKSVRQQTIVSGIIASTLNIMSLSEYIQCTPSLNVNFLLSSMPTNWDDEKFIAYSCLCALMSCMRNVYVASKYEKAALTIIRYWVSRLVAFYMQIAFEISFMAGRFFQNAF